MDHTVSGTHVGQSAAAVTRYLLLPVLPLAEEGFSTLPDRRDFPPSASFLHLPNPTGLFTSPPRTGPSSSKGGLTVDRRRVGLTPQTLATAELGGKDRGPQLQCMPKPRAHNTLVILISWTLRIFEKPALSRSTLEVAPGTWGMLARSRTPRGTWLRGPRASHLAAGHLGLGELTREADASTLVSFRKSFTLPFAAIWLSIPAAILHILPAHHGFSVPPTILPQGVHHQGDAMVSVGHTAATAKDIMDTGGLD